MDITVYTRRGEGCQILSHIPAVNKDWKWFSKGLIEFLHFLDEFQQWSGVLRYGLVGPVLKVKVVNFPSPDVLEFPTLFIKPIRKSLLVKTT